MKVTIYIFGYNFPNTFPKKTAKVLTAVVLKFIKENLVMGRRLTRVLEGSITIGQGCSEGRSMLELIGG